MIPHPPQRPAIPVGKLKEVLAVWAFGHNVRFYFTPSQTSWLNRIESQFTALKEFALNNSDYRSHQEQIEAILRYLDWRNRKRAIALTDWKEHRRDHAVPA